MARRKHRPLPPRRKRMNRKQRLQAAPRWVAGYRGKHVVAGYQRWFGVDILCAIAELRLLGVAIEAAYEQAVRTSLAGQQAARARRKAEQAALASGYGEWWNDEFAFIAGWTSGGAVYGVRWEEMPALEEEPQTDRRPENDGQPYRAHRQPCCTIAVEKIRSFSKHATDQALPRLITVAARDRRQNE